MKHTQAAPGHVSPRSLLCNECLTTPQASATGDIGSVYQPQQLARVHAVPQQ